MTTGSTASTAPSTDERPTDERRIYGMTVPDVVFVACAALFAVVLVLTNIVGVKLFELFPDGRPTWLPGSGGVTLTTGIITYPITFLLTDLVAEMWGKKRADLMVVLGFLMSFVMLGVVQVARMLPPSAVWTNPALGLGATELEQAFQASFYYPGLLLFASMTAYLVAQLFDVRLYHFWWRVTGGRHMWIRNNGSTLISQLVDTIIVNGIFLHWGLDLAWSDVWSIIVAVYLCKVVLAALDTPLIYLGRAFLRRLFRIPADVSIDRAPLER